MNAAQAKAVRDAAFKKALEDYTRTVSQAQNRYTLKERARNPALGARIKAEIQRAGEDYHAARAQAQAEYLAATTSTTAPATHAATHPTADCDAGLYDGEDPPPTRPAPIRRADLTMEQLNRLIDREIKEELKGFKEDLGQGYLFLPSHTADELDAACALQRKDSDPASVFKYKPL